MIRSHHVCDDLTERVPSGSVGSQCAPIRTGASARVRISQGRGDSPGSLARPASARAPTLSKNAVGTLFATAATASRRSARTQNLRNLRGTLGGNPVQAISHFSSAQECGNPVRIRCGCCQWRPSRPRLAGQTPINRIVLFCSDLLLYCHGHPRRIAPPRPREPLALRLS